MPDQKQHAKITPELEHLWTCICLESNPAAALQNFADALRDARLDEAKWWAEALADVVTKLEAWADQLDKTPSPVEAQHVRACALLVRDALTLPADAPPVQFQGSQDGQTNALGEGLEGSVLRSYTPAAQAAEPDGPALRLATWFARTYLEPKRVPTYSIEEIARHVAEEFGKRHRGQISQEDAKFAFDFVEVFGGFPKDQAIAMLIRRQTEIRDEPRTDECGHTVDWPDLHRASR